MKNQNKDTRKSLINYAGPDQIISSFDLAEQLKYSKDMPVIKSKLPLLDYHLEGGFEGGELISLSGPPKVGKSLLMQTLTLNFLDQKYKSLWFQYEITPRRFLEGFKALPKFYLPQKLEAYNLDWIEKRVLEAILKHGIKIVFIDHLHYLFDLVSQKNTSLQIGNVIRTLKQIAVKYNIIIFLACHMKKVNFDKEPSDEDIRDCLPKGQLVYSNGARIPIENVKKELSVISLSNNHKLQNDKVLNWWKTGEKDIYRIVTESGRTLECSSGQKFYATKPGIKGKMECGKNPNGQGLGGWVKLKDLAVNRKIAVVRKYPDIQNETISKEKAIILGWIIGDGHVNKKYYVDITTSKKSEAEFVKKIADAEFDLNCKITKYKKKNAYRIFLTGYRKGDKKKRNQLTAWLKKLRFNPTGKDKYIPSFIFKESNRIIGGLLSGLFQADGSVYKSVTFIINLCSISERLIFEVQHLLLRFGILSKIRSQDRMVSGFRTKNSVIWSLSITGTSIIKFANEIGFYLKKKEKLKKLMSQWYPKDKERKGDIWFEKLKSIEYIGKKPTYDIEVRGHHRSLVNNSYCVNDILTHNSSLIGGESDTILIIWRVPNTDTEAVLKLRYARRSGARDKKIKLVKVDGVLRQKDEK